jgi:pimeloyl-ACP methyl ester carboxylesterase
VREFATVVSYDRAGFGWSESDPRPRTPNRLAAELNSLLKATKLPPPYVLVGHSFGGLVIRAYANAYPREVTGLVLVDALNPREWATPDAERKRMLRGGQLLAATGALLASLGIVRWLLARADKGASALPKGVLRLFGSKVNGTVLRVVGEVTKLPRELWPYARAYWSLPRSFWTMKRYFAALPRSSAEMLMKSHLPDVPLIVLSAQSTDPRHQQWQRELVGLCRDAEHQVVPECGHWLHLDRPELVIEAIQKLVTRYRGAPAAQPVATSQPT